MGSTEDILQFILGRANFLSRSEKYTVFSIASKKVGTKGILFDLMSFLKSQVNRKR